MSTDIKPWDRMANETAKQFEAFKKYRDLGPSRSIKEARGGGWARFDQWSAQNNWVKRAAAYDAFLDKQAMNERIKAIREMQERHARIAVAMQNKAVARLNQIRPEDLSAAELLRWVEATTKIERLARGESTERTTTEHTGSLAVGAIDLSKLTDDEFDNLQTIIARASSGGGG